MTLSVGMVLTSISRNAGGLFNSVRAAVQQLELAGCEVSVYAIRDEFSEADLAAWRPIVPRLFDAAGPPSLGYAPTLSGALGDHDVLHQHGLWQAISITTARWGHRTGRPTVIAPRGMLDPWALRNSGWKKRIASALYENRNLRTAACIQVLGLSEARSVRAAGLAAPLAVIPNAITPPLKDCAERFDRSGRRTLLFLGRLHPKKGLSELIEAWGHLAQSSPALVRKWRLELAGWDDGGHLEALRRQAANLPDACEVIFPGPVFDDSKHEAFCRADAFILPSYSEGLPMAVLEAWAYSLPTFITDECNLPEAFAEGAAIRIERDPRKLAETLSARLEENNEAIGARARQLCAERFTWSSVAGNLIQTYRWLRFGEEMPACVIPRAGAVDDFTGFGKRQNPAH
ncbi:glycosyltransferase [Aurantiacibacter spongiae]|uniref:Glycosyltransferase n=1 Tax=Aurantiacibacter spongiae TaxID=2488860 RepID=A0A3N5CV77_9SPHN|nr:glycosyltransferase [Aurantiacibacter spongiae]RPF70529.1 glycosyltransferase [Aurantiacibacter spongiae]